jgi:3-isopropylmalate/(R)-2-methylmalate dehydratase small subunit
MSSPSKSAGAFTTQTFNLPLENIDTDQIIPAQFLTTTEREGLGRFCFYNWRYQPDGAPREAHALQGFDRERHAVIVAGSNFGCGSSREHAPWALLDMGVKAVISSRFADIFRNNSLKNGLLPITVSDEIANWLLQHPGVDIKVDIAGTRFSVPGLGEIAFPLDPFPAYCLSEGIDQLDFLLRHQTDIHAYEQQRAH